MQSSWLRRSVGRLVLGLLLVSGLGTAFGKEYQIAVIPKLRAASEKSSRPRVASGERAGALSETAATAPFKDATYAATTVRSLRLRVFPKAGIAVPVIPREMVVLIYA